MNSNNDIHTHVPGAVGDFDGLGFSLEAHQCCHWTKGLLGEGKHVLKYTYTHQN